MSNRFIYLLLCLIVFTSGAFASVTLSNTTTQYNVSNGLIKMVTSIGSTTDILSYNGSWNKVTHFYITFNNGTVFNTQAAATVNILEESADKVVIGVTHVDMTYNLTLESGVPYFKWANSTAMPALRYLDVKVGYAWGGLNADYFYSPNNSLNDLSTYSGLAVKSYGGGSYVIDYSSVTNNSFFLVSDRAGGFADEYKNYISGGNMIHSWDGVYGGIPEHLTFGVLNNIDVSTVSGDVATDYFWDSWAVTGDAPTDYIRYWDFNEGTGTTADDKGSDDADLTAVSTPPWVHGKQSWGTDLDGAADYWSSTDLTTITDDTVGSICGWFNLGGNPTALRTLFALSDVSENYKSRLILYLDHAADNFKLSCISDGNTNFWLASPVNTEFSDYTNQWNHYCVIQDGSGVELYLNNELITLTNVAASPAKTVWISNITGGVNQADTLVIGGEANNNVYHWFYDGALDEVRIYSDALTTAEVTALYGQGLPDTLSNSYSSTYAGVTQTPSHAETFANASLVSIDTTNVTNILGTNSNYTVNTHSYSLITNDFGVTANATNDLFTSCSNCYNFVPIANNTYNFTTADGFTLIKPLTCQVEAYGTSWPWNMTAWWHFSEGSGTWATPSLEPNHTVMNFTGINGWASGHNGTAVDVGDAPVTGLTNGGTLTEYNTADFSVCFWFYPSTTETRFTTPVINKEANITHDYWSIQRDNNNDQLMIRFNADESTRVYSVVSPDQTWTQWCITADESDEGGTLNFYKNGDLVTTDTTNDKFYNDNEGRYRLQAEPTSAHLIDELILFNYTLNQEEVQNIYNDFPAGGCAYSKLSYTPTINPAFGLSNKATIPYCNSSVFLTLWDEDNFETSVIGGIGIDLNLSDYTQYSLSQLSKDNYELMICPYYGNVSVNTKITSGNVSNNYYDRLYYHQDTVFTNQTLSTKLFLLSNTGANDGSIQYIVKYRNGTLVEDAIIQIEHQYVGYGGNYIVAMAGRTDADGEASTFISYYSTDYSISVMKDGVLLKHFLSHTFTSSENPYTLYIDDEVALPPTMTGRPIVAINRTGNVINMSIADSDSNLELTYLEVFRQGVYNTTSICNQTIIGVSGGTYCNVTNYLLGNDFLTYRITVTESGTSYLLTSGYFDFATRDDYGDDGVVALFLLVLTASLLGLAISGQMALLMAGVGLFLGSLWLMPITYMITLPIVVVLIIASFKVGGK